MYGLHTAECLLAAASRKYGLVIGCEVLSRITDFTDRSTCVLFGDGAGAAILEWGEDYPSLCAVMGSRGNRQVLMIPGVNTGSPNFIHMDGKEVFPLRSGRAAQVRQRGGGQGRHQPGPGGPLCVPPGNQRILDYAIKKLKIDPARCAGNIARTGNTSAASVPLLLDELVTSGPCARASALCAPASGGRPDLGRRPAAAGLTDDGSPNSPSLFDSLTKELL